MTTTFSPRIAAGLRGRLSGRVVLPGEQDYDAARQVWNASHDHRPALIVQPRTTGDVQAAVRFAGEHGLPVCVRGGGHNHAGYAVADGALMLDLSAMTSVRVDPARRRAIVGGGAACPPGPSSGRACTRWAGTSQRNGSAPPTARRPTTPATPSGSTRTSARGPAGAQPR